MPQQTLTLTKVYRQDSMTYSTWWIKLTSYDELASVLSTVYIFIFRYVAQMLKLLVTVQNNIQFLKSSIRWNIHSDVRDAAWNSSVETDSRWYTTSFLMARLWWRWRWWWQCYAGVCGLFFTPCFACKVSSRLGENCCVPVLGGGVIPLRLKTRMLFNIHVSLHWLNLQRFQLLKCTN